MLEGRCVATLAFVFAALTGARAQDRVATTGRVVDVDGAPVAGATVSFVGARLPIVDAYADVDRVDVRTGGDGSFTASLLRWADYSAWAARPGGQTSRLRELVAAGDALVFVVAIPPPFEHVRIDGLDAWDAHRPDAVSAAPALPVLAPRPLVLARDRETAALPPFPGAWHVFVRDAAGALVHAQTIEPRSDDGGEGAEGVVAVPRPYDVRARCVDDDGTPVAGAAIWLCVGERLQRAPGGPDLRQWREVGRTGRDGTLPVSIAMPRKLELGVRNGPVLLSRPLLLAARAPGHWPAVVGWEYGNLRGGATAPAPEDSRDVPLLLSRGDGIVAHTIGFGNVVRARAAPTFLVRSAPPPQRGFRLVADDDGPWQPHTPTEGPVRASTTMPTPDGPVPVITLLDAYGQRSTPIDELAILRLRAPDAAAPGLGVRLLVQPVLPHASESPLHYTTTLWRPLPATLRLGVGRWRVLATDGNGVAYHELDLLPGATDVALDLQPIARQRGRLHARGETVRASMVRVDRGARRPSESGSAAIAVELEPFSYPPPLQPLPRLPDGLAQELAAWLAARATFAADGSFVVPVLRCYEPRVRLRITDHDGTAVLPAYAERR